MARIVRDRLDRAGLLAARLRAQFVALRGAWAELDAGDISLACPILDAGYVLSNVVLALRGTLPTPRQWRLR